jgi:hypothetical protein
MTKRLTDGQIEDLIREIEFQPLKITVAKPPTAKSGSVEGALLDVRWKNSSLKFIAEILRQATPKQIETGMLRLEKNAREAGGDKAGKEHLYPMLVAPFLSERTLQRLAEAEISGIDLSGNGVVVVPEKLFVYRAGAKNKFVSNAPIKNVFRGTSSLVARVFFSKPEYENVGEVLEEITTREGKTTFSTVSKVLKTLEEELLISRNEKIRLLDAKKLLAALRENYRRPEVRRSLRAKVSDLQPVLKRISKNAEAQNLQYALDDPAKYAVMPSGASIVKIYAESIDDLLDGVNFTETNRFPDIEFIETDDGGVYFDRRKDAGFYWLSPLQTYLELANEGKREQETASEMLKGLLDFKY